MNGGNPEISSDDGGVPAAGAVPRGTIHYWAAAREAAGVAAEPYAAATLAQALDTAVASRGGTDDERGRALARVLTRCAFVVDGAPASRRDPATVLLTDGGIVEVLPPFAGGCR